MQESKKDQMPASLLRVIKLNHDITRIATDKPVTIISHKIQFAVDAAFALRKLPFLLQAFFQSFFSITSRIGI